MKHLFKYLSLCHVCSGIKLSENLICRTCLREFEFRIPHSIISEKQINFDLIYLIPWSVNDKFISKLINESKRHPFLENYYSKILSPIYFLLMELDNIEEWVIIPAPSFSNERAYHSLTMAEILSKESGIKVVDTLRKIEAVGQKKLNKKQRARLRLNTVSSEQYKKVIFVDDVYTTGSTAKASYWALSRPEEFLCITIFRRLLIDCANS